MSFLYHEILYRPLFNALVFLYETVAFQDLGVAIILLTLVIRLILYPLFYRSFRNQALMQRIQPEIKRIQADHKHDRGKQAEALMALYKEHKVNPFSGFFLILIQLPVLLALYQVIGKGFTGDFAINLYSFVRAPAFIGDTFLHLIKLTESNILIIVLAAGAQYLQAKLAVQKVPPGGDPKTQQIAKSMVFAAPLITLLLFYKLPSAIGLYWLATSLFSALQQQIINRNLSHGNLPIQSKSNP